MPSFDELKPFIVLGFALGGVYAMSGVGLVVLYRATGVLNLAYGAIGCAGALLTWELLDNDLGPQWLAYLACVAFGGVVTLAYGLLLGPAFAPRDPLVKATATLGLLLILVGWMQWHYGQIAHGFTLPTTRWNYQVGDVRISWTQIIGAAFPILLTAGTALYLRVTKVGTAMRALADDREITSMLGVPVRRVEAAAWFGSGIVCGISGLASREPRRHRHRHSHVPRGRRAGGCADRPAQVALGHARRGVRDRGRAVVAHRVRRGVGVPHDDAVRPRDPGPPLDRGPPEPRRGADLTWARSAPSNPPTRSPSPRGALGDSRRARSCGPRCSSRSCSSCSSCFPRG